MSRQNFWDVIQNAEIDPLEEVKKIENLFSNDKLNCGLWSTIEDHIDNRYFLDWKYRRSCLNISDLRKLGNILTKRDLRNYNSISIEDMLLYFEFILTMIYLIKYPTESIRERRRLISANINDILDRYNLKVAEIEDSIYIIVEKSEEVTSVSELYPEIAPKIIEYNRFALKGNLQRKRELLVAIAHKFEGVENKLQQCNEKLVDNVNTLLNNLNLRHNNEEGHNAKPVVIEMKDNQLESWYDKTYDTLLLALLYANYVDYQCEIKDLRKSLK